MSADSADKEDAQPFLPEPVSTPTQISNSGSSIVDPQRARRYWPWAFRLAAVLVGVAFLANLWRRKLAAGAYVNTCDTGLAQGEWASSKKPTWHTDMCYIHPYTKTEVTACLANTRSVFIGDSTVRDVYHAMKRRLIKNSTDQGEKHSDMSVKAPNGIELQFYWDPWWNRTDVLESEWRDGGRRGSGVKNANSLMVYGAGLWYMRYGGESGYEDFKQAVDKLLDGAAGSGRKNEAIAEMSVVRPLVPLVSEKLRPDRKEAMTPSKMSRYNDYLRLKMWAPAKKANLHIPEYTWALYADAPDRTLDGMHYDATVVDNEVELYLNEMCNKQLFASNPAGKATCCVDYAPIKSKQWAVILLLAVFGAVAYLWRLCVAKTTITGGVINKPKQTFFLDLFDKVFPKLQPAADLTMLCIALFYMLLVDRTSYLPKTNKIFSLAGFSLSTFLYVAAGFATLARPPSSSPSTTDYLSRLQTDEWKGWMQLSILVYHYLGASRITPIYASIRILVASYLFMTGYGHFIYFYTKKEFGLQRVVTVLVRLNFLSVLMGLVMDKDVLFYYFGPLVSWWFLIVYLTMAIGAQHNGKKGFLAMKLGIAIVFCWVVVEIPVMLETTFGLLNSICATTWDARETAFRLGLDRYIVFVGMLVAWAKLTIVPRVASSPSWIKHKRRVLALSLITLIAYAFFIAFSPNKFWYNYYHPLLSPFAVVSYTILRNYTLPIRSTTSTYFRWVGRNSLELFLLQYHVWLGVDTKGVVGLGYGGMWMSCLVLGVVFFGIAERIGGASGRIVEWAVGNGMKRIGVGVLAVVLWNWV